MRICVLALGVLAITMACSDPAADETIGGVDQTATKEKEPSFVTVDHILIAARHPKLKKVTRTVDEARKLAGDVLAEIEAGGDWDALKKRHSDDPGPDGNGGGPYTMSNFGVPVPRDAIPRDEMVPAFGDVGFKLEVGEIRMADHDPRRSPYGFHIIKRVR